jgi:hypothetical protein
MQQREVYVYLLFYDHHFEKQKMGIIKYHDLLLENDMVFMTKYFDFKAIEISQLYKHR